VAAETIDITIRNPVSTTRRPGFVPGRVVARRSLRRALIWGAVFGLVTWVEVSSFAEEYPTLADRARAAVTCGSNIGLQAIFGPVHHIGTVAGYTAFHMIVAGLIGAVWGLLTGTRLVRGEEEALGAGTRRGDDVPACDSGRARRTRYRAAHVLGRGRHDHRRGRMERGRRLLHHVQHVRSARRGVGGGDVPRRRGVLQPTVEHPPSGRCVGSRRLRPRVPHSARRLQQHLAPVGALGQPARLGRRAATPHRQPRPAPGPDFRNDRDPGHADDRAGRHARPRGRSPARERRPTPSDAPALRSDGARRSARMADRRGLDRRARRGQLRPRSDHQAHRDRWANQNGGFLQRLGGTSGGAIYLGIAFL
jgi:hypothetical protein